MSENVSKSTIKKRNLIDKHRRGTSYAGYGLGGIVAMLLLYTIGAVSGSFCASVFFIAIGVFSIMAVVGLFMRIDATDALYKL